MSLPECGFENNTKFSSVRKREILHQDIFDAVLSIKMTELVPKTKMTCSFLLNSIIHVLNNTSVLAYICWLPSGHLVHLLSEPFRQSAFPQSFLPRLFPGHVCRQRLFCNLNIGGRDSRELVNASSQWRKVKKMILGTEPKFHVDWSKNKRDRGLYTFAFRFLDKANTSSMSYMLTNLTMIIFPFYRAILSCLEAEKWC